MDDVLADCPRDVRVSEMHKDFTVNSTLSCGSDAYPTAQYAWNIIGGSGFVVGEVFVIDSPGFFNISCTADNFLNLPDPDVECSKTVFATGYVPVPPKRTLHVGKCTNYLVKMSNRSIGIMQTKNYRRREKNFTNVMQ